MKAWMTKALELLVASLEPPKHELNECDWKAVGCPHYLKRHGVVGIPS
jgi:hypothetical protein